MNEKMEKVGSKHQKLYQKMKTKVNKSRVQPRPRSKMARPDNYIYEPEQLLG